MAPPQLVSLENYSDVQFRDVVHRRSQLVAPTANVIQKLYHHTDGSTVRLSGAELLTTDAGGNVQYSLMLGSNTAFLNANTLTFSNLSSWTANSVFTANNSHFTVRTPTLTANAISCQILNLSNDVKFANVTATNMMVTGNITVDTSTLTVDPTNNRVGIVQTTPQYPLDVAGDANLSAGSVLRIAGTQVLSSSTVNVTGNATFGNVSSNAITGTWASLTGNVAVGNLRSNAITGTWASLTGNVAVGNLSSNAITGTWASLTANVAVGNLRSNAIIGTYGNIGFLEVTSNATFARLTTSGNVNFDGNGFIYNAETNRVGINKGTPNPAYALDVNGDVNVESSWGYYVAGKKVLSEIALGDSVATSNLTTLGNLSTLRVEGTTNLTDTNITGNVKFTGQDFDLGSWKTVSLKRSITANPNVVGSGVAAGGIAGSSYVARVHLLQNEDSNNRISKVYEFVMDKYSASNGGVRQRAIPVQSGTIDTSADYNDLGLDVAAFGGGLSFAIVRTRVGANCSGNNITLTMVVYYPKDQPVTFTSDGEQSTFTATQFYNGNQMTTRSTQFGTGIAIGSDGVNGNVRLDVNGVTRIQGNLIVGATGTASDTNRITALGTDHRIDGTATYTLTRTIAGSTLYSGALVGNVSSSGGVVEVRLNQLETTSKFQANSFVKTYRIPYHFASYYEGWKRALCDESASDALFQEGDLALDVRQTAPNWLELAIVRTKVSANTEPSTAIQVSVTTHYNKSLGYGFFPVTGTYTGFNPGFSDLYFGTPISKRYGCVGIWSERTDSPYRFESNVYSGFRQGLWVENGEFGGGLCFGNLWRIYLNPATQNLEIQYNNNTNDYSWSSNVVTGILAAR